MAVAVSGGSKRRARAAGFSLIEVLVALAIFAVLASSVVLQSGSFSSQLFRIEEKTLALWAAQNALDAARVASGTAQVGNSSEDTELGGRTWRVQQSVSQTSRPGFMRIDVSVSREDEDGSVVTLSGFLAER